MARWDYDLKNRGTQLRDLIRRDDSSKENCENILNQVVECLKYLQTKLTEEDRDWYEFDLEDMIQDCEDTKAYLDEYDEDSNEDNINDILDEFYDLMDSMRVWVAL